MDNVEYTTEQRERAIELWTRILDGHQISASKVETGWYGSTHHTYVERREITQEIIGALIDSDGTESDDQWAVEITLADYSDYGGSDLDAANVRALDGTPGVSVCTGGVHGNGSATMTLGELPGDDTETVADRLDRLEHVADMVDAMCEYGLIDDQTHYEYIDEMADAAWDQYLASDITGDLARVGPDQWEITDGVTAELRTAYYGCEENNWYGETATSVINDHHDKAVAHAAMTVLGWDYPAMVTARKLRDDQEARDREAFHAVWQAFLDAYPLPYFAKWTREHEATMFRILRDRGMPARVANILAVIWQESEVAAYRDAERRAANQTA